MLGHVYKYNGSVLVIGKLVKWKGEIEAKNPDQALKFLSLKFLKEAELHPHTRVLLQKKFLVEKETVML